MKQLIQIRNKMAKQINEKLVVPYIASAFFIIKSYDYIKNIKIPYYLYLKPPKIYKLNDEVKERENNGRLKGEGLCGYFAIALSVALLYIMSIRSSVLFYAANVPRGDPFTYMNGFFMLLDRFHNNFWSTLTAIPKSGWYWLTDFMLAFLSPFLFKEPFSLALINFVLFGLASASIFRMARYLNFNVFFSFILSLILWLSPSNYGFRHPVSLLTMQLDTAFLYALVIAAANIIIYSFDIKSTKNALIAAVSVGIAVWGRGNSLPYVSIIVIYPLIVIFKEFLIEISGSKKQKVLLNLIIFCSVALFMTGWFYAVAGKGILEYYSPHKVIIDNATTDYKFILPILRDVPGWFFYYKGNCLFVTITLHFIVILSLLAAFLKNKKIESNKRYILKYLSIAGAVIFYGIYLFNLILFHDQQIIFFVTYSPMLVGLALSTFSLMAFLFLLIKDKVNFNQNIGIFISIVLILVYANFLTVSQTSLVRDQSAASPREVEMFAKDLDKFLEGRSLAFLWYEMYNYPIINYYRIKNDLVPINFYTNEYYKYLWVPPYLAENNENIRMGIKKTFEDADFVIIPEFSNYYFKQEPYPLYQRSDDLANYLNSPESPKFVVRMVLHEPGGVRLLLLQRAEDALLEGARDYEQFRLPYGPSTILDTKNYASVMSDKFETIVADVPFSWKSALDNNTDTFWEENGSYPHWIQVKYRGPVIINKYALQAVPDAHGGNDRMPMGWILQGSNDNQKWVDLDSRSGQANWKNNEERIFGISKPGAYKFYRLYCTNGRPDIIRLYELKLYMTT